MKIAVVGGGPAGLYFAMLAKRADAGHEITVHERNRADDTFGFGVVFSEKTMNYLRQQDQSTYDEILANSYAWDPIEVRIHGQVLSCGGIGFWAISRKRLLDILQRGAARQGVVLRFESEVRLPEAMAADNDLVAIGDGVNSQFRSHYAEYFRPVSEVGRTVFAWYGAALRYPSFTFLFAENRHGRFCAHIYPYEEDLSTFIVEMDPQTWKRAGLERSNRKAQAPGQSDLYGMRYFEELFRPHLEGRGLLANNSKWANFRTVRNATWHHRNLVLMGDAAHTAHFSVGSGTKMAMEDAIALAFALQQNGPDLDRVFAAYEAERRPRVDGIQRAARPSLRWYEQFRHYWDFSPEQFAFHFLTRSNFDYAQLKERDPGFVRDVEVAISSRLRSLSELMTLPSEFTPPIAVTEDGRFSPETSVQIPEKADGRVLRLVHAGRRGSVRSAAGGLDRPLHEDGWVLLAPSSISYTSQSRAPRKMNRDDMVRVRDAYRDAATRGANAGYERLLLEMSGGQLLHSFLSPLTNRRDDSYGGSLPNRLRYPLEVAKAVRAAWPGRLWVSISATDWLPGGFTDDESIVLARSLREIGADLLLVRSGHVTPEAVPWYSRCFNAQFSDRIRNEVSLPVMVAGGILSIDDVKNVLLAGRADRVLIDPGWTP